MEDLIRSLSKFREDNRGRKELVTVTLGKKELGIIIASLKMYNAFDKVLTEEIGIIRSE